MGYIVGETGGSLELNLVDIQGVHCRNSGAEPVRYIGGKTAGILGLSLFGV